ncbi:MAG: hypothetical protein ABI199_08125 [Bacteroidia bacterium]
MDAGPSYTFELNNRSKNAVTIIHIAVRKGISEIVALPRVPSLSNVFVKHSFNG